MKLALLGCDAFVIELIRTAKEKGGHKVTLAIAPGRCAAQLQQLAPDAPFHDAWTALLEGPPPDVVIVASRPTNGHPFDALRQLAQDGVALLLVHPAMSAIEAYELEMIQQENQVPLITVCPGLDHPALARLAEWSQGNAPPSVGSAQQVVVQRALADRDRHSVLDHLARDLLLARTFLGSIRRVTAVAANSDERLLTNLHVTASTDQGALLQWSVTPAAQGESVTWTWIGQQGTATLAIPLESGKWTLRVPPLPDEHWDRDPTVDYAWGRLETPTRNVPPRRVGWLDTCRVLDATEAAEISLLRGRSVDTIADQPSEESAFKGIMSAAGCGLLLLTLLIFVVGASIEGLWRPWRDSGSAAQAPGAQSADQARPDGPAQGPARNVLWRWWPAYPLLLFLLLQFLRIVARRPRTPAIAGGQTMPAKAGPGETSENDRIRSS